MSEKITITLPLDIAYNIEETLRREKVLAMEDYQVIKGTGNRYGDMYQEIANRKNETYIKYLNAVANGTVTDDDDNIRKPV